MRDFVTGELVDYGPNGRPAEPIAADGTPFARIRNGVHQLGLAGSGNVDAAAQELAGAIEEALPAALAAWPDKERLLPLQRLKSHLAELRHHSDWKGALQLLLDVRSLLPELIDRAHMAEATAMSRADAPTSQSWDDLTSKQQGVVAWMLRQPRGSDFSRTKILEHADGVHDKGDDRAVIDGLIELGIARPSPGKRTQVRLGVLPTRVPSTLQRDPSWLDQ